MALALPDDKSWSDLLKGRTGWAVYAVKGKRKRKLVLVDTAAGGLEQALAVLKDDCIQFFGFRVTGIDERAGAKSIRQKVVTVCYIGENTPTMKKAGAGVIAGEAFAFMRSAHVQFTTDDKTNLTPEEVEKKLRASGGAHQVQRYDFTNAEGAKAKVKKKTSIAGTVKGKSGRSFEIADSSDKKYRAEDGAYASRGVKKVLTKEEQAAKAKAERTARENAGAADKASDSNIDGYGGEEHEKMKAMAAAAEINWEGAGTEVGLQIWRVENKKGNFGVNHWPKDKYGQFFDGDSYIVLHTYKVPAGPAEEGEEAAAEGEEEDADGALAFDLYFWIGKDSSQDERGVVAYKTVELDDYLGGKPVQCRCVQGYEPERFMQLFADKGGMIVMAGGIESGFNIVKPEEYEPRLLQVKGKGKNIAIAQVPFAATSMNKGDVFVLDGGLQLYQWNGPECNPNEKVRARMVVEEIYANRQRGDGIVKTPIFMDDDDCDEFWELLKGSPEDVLSAEAGGADEEVEKSDPELFCISDKTGSIKYERVAVGKLKKSMLGTGDVYVVDTDTEVYVWVGAGANRREKRCAMLFAQDYLSCDDGEHENSPITRLHERDPVLPYGFKACFTDLKD